jgi:hypothetical protein
MLALKKLGFITLRYGLLVVVSQCPKLSPGLRNLAARSLLAQAQGVVTQTPKTAPESTK